MSQEGTPLEPPSCEEELSDYRILLSCMRRRLEARAMTEALDLVDQLDDAISRGISTERPRPRLRIVK